MSDSQNIPKDEWETYKERIEKLYQGNTLKKVIALMKQDHGFDKKKHQYLKKINKWKISKNSTKDNWKFVTRRVEKREQEGKETEVRMNGKFISDKRLRQEQSRNPLPSYYGAIDTAPSPQTPAGVEVYTPSGNELGDRYVEYLHIPWFELEELMQSYVESLQSQISLPSPILNSWEDRISPGIPDIYSPNAPFPPTQLSSQQWSFCDNEFFPQTGFAVSHPADHSTNWNSSVGTTGETQSLLSTRVFDEKGRSTLMAIIGGPGSALNKDIVTAITSKFDGFLPERRDGELVQKIKQVFDISSSMTDSALQLLRYSVFLSSNNLSRNFQVDILLNWIIETKQFFLIKYLVKIKTPAVEIFLTDLILSAVRLWKVDIVLALLSCGIDVNALAGEYKITVLHEVVKSWVMHGNSDSKLDLVRILLKAGANPNAKSAFGWIRSTLQLAVDSRNSHELVQILLDAGGDVNVEPNESAFPNTLLAEAATNKDSILIRILLESKAEINVMTETSITALQAAAYSGDVESVQILVAAGADVNAPFGFRYEIAREVAAEDGRYKHLASPIQFAAHNDNVEMVQILMQSNADVEGYNLARDGIFFKEIDVKERDNFECLQTPLQHAVMNENIILVRLLLSAGANTNARPYGNTPLQIAAQQGNIALVQLLLRNGAHVNAAQKQDGGRTALQYAAYYGKIDIVQVLLDAGANVHALPAPQDGRTAIQAAAEGGHLEIVRTLVECGANINAAPSRDAGRTCIQAAAGKGLIEMIQLLLKLGANVNAPAATYQGRTALQAAIEARSSASVDILLNAGADVNAAPSPIDGISALSGAIANGDLQLTRRLLVTADPNGATNEHPPIVLAAKLELVDHVRSLIQAGADVDFLGIRSDTESALQAAVKSGNIEVVHILLKAQANVNASTATGSLNPLELAVHWNYINIVRLLLGNGASCDPPPRVGSPSTTALCEALWRLSVNEEIVEDLIVAGANVNLGSRDYGLPLAMAARHFRLTQRLLRAGARVNGYWPGKPTALQVACRGHDIDTVQLLLGAGADVNAPAKQVRGRTALQAAVETGKTSIINLLLQNGAEYNAVASERYGGTALQLAAMKGRVAIVSLLLRAGAQINAEPAAIEGRTALEAAAEHGRLDVVSLLLRNDSDLDGLDVRCEKAAKLAAENGHPVISSLLREYKNNNTD